MQRCLPLALIALALVFQGCAGETTPTTDAIQPQPGEAAPTSVVPHAEEHIASVDLTAFAEAWSERDIDRIRFFYLDDAVYISDEEVVALQRGEQVRAHIADDMFSSTLSAYEGLRMRILGDPIQIFDKLVGFAFRWQDDLTGYNGVALLRYEDKRIWLHTYAVEHQRTPNPSADSLPFETVDMGPLMEAWSSGDVDAVRSFYTDIDGVVAVFNDEDILYGLRGNLHSPDELAGEYLASEVVTQAASWGMAAIGRPVRVGELVLMAWRFEAFTYPSAYGVRFLRYDEDSIVTDIRYAIRPWEAQGQSFASGYP